MKNEWRPAAHTAEILTLVLALLLLVATAIFSYRSWISFGRESSELTTSTAIMNQTNALLASLTDAETGQRGFLLTGEQRYLEPYNRAMVSAPLELNALRGAVADVPDQQERTGRLAPLVGEKLRELAETVELRRSLGLEAALAVVRTDRGKITMDQVRAICAEIQSTASLRLTRSAEQARASANQLGWIATLGGVILFALVGLATITIQSTNLKRQRLIAELRVSEGQTKEARDWLQTTLASIGDGVIATDAEGNVSFLNPVARDLTGWSEAEAMGKSLETIFVIHNEDTWAVVENPVRRALREGRIVGLANHTVLTAKDGKSISIDDSAAPIRNQRGDVTGVVLVFRDVSAAREKEREKERSRSALANANRDLQQFAYAASHDLREPLRTIRIFAEMLRDEAKSLDAGQREHLAFIISGADRMEQLVNALLEYATAGALIDRPLREVNVDEVLAGTLNNLRAAIEESRAAITHDPLPTVRAEPAHLSLVFQNLIGNAIKYRGDRPPRIHVSAKQSGDEWIFTVADNGIGIQPEYHSSIFDIFKRLHHPNLSGSGIGLATCRRIVERYNGQIGVESELGKGSTFFFSLPVQDGAGIPADAA